LPGARGPLFQVVPSVKLKLPGGAEVTKLKTVEVLLGFVSLVTLKVPSGVAARQLAVTTTLFGGIVKVAVGVLGRVMPPWLTVQPAKV